MNDDKRLGDENSRYRLLVFQVGDCAVFFQIKSSATRFAPGAHVPGGLDKDLCRCPAWRD